MDWKDLGKSLANVGLRAVGAAVGGPFGASIGGQLASVLGCDNEPDAVQQALATASPDTLVKLRELDTQIQLANIEAGIQERKADTIDLQTVNETMRQEAKSEHWAQWLWRPFNGFMFGITFFCVYFLIPLINFGMDTGNRIEIPHISESTWMIWGTVLGVTAWGRNTLKQAQAGNAPPTILGAVATRIKEGGKK